MWECKGRKDGRGEWGGPDFMTVEGPGFSLSGPATDRSKESDSVKNVFLNGFRDVSSMFHIMMYNYMSKKFV